MRIIVAVLALAIAALATTSAYAEAIWEHFNADPAYQSREAAIADAPRVLRQVGYPEPVILLLTEAMKKPGVEAHVTNGRKLDFMRSGKSALWRNVLVKFKKPPREESMEYSAPSEEWTVELNGTKWMVGIPKVCNNLYGERLAITPKKEALPAKPRALSPPNRTIASCPAINYLKVNVWPPDAFKLPGVRQTHAKEELGQKQFAGVPHVSKTHGGQFRRACADGVVCQSEKPHAFRVSLIMTPEARGIQDSQITKEEILGDIIVTGVYDALQFTRAQLEEWDAIRLVAIDDDVTSPPRYLATGVHELRFFNRLPRKTLGEWDENPVPDCIMNEHWIE